MDSTTLAVLLDEMNVHKDIANIETQFKVKAIDKAIRALKRVSVFPWSIKKGSLKVFSGVKEYPVADDHDEMLYLDDSNVKYYSDTARFVIQSANEFYLDENVFRPSILSDFKMRFKLSSNRRAQLIIYDLSGAYIRRLVDGPCQAGWNYTSWDGKDDDGRRMGSDIFIAILTSGTYQKAHKFIVVR